MEMDKETNDALTAKVRYVPVLNVLVVTRGIAALDPKPLRLS
jgi:hypothetical protein